jgi:phage terminase large subunit-like protein
MRKNPTMNDNASNVSMTCILSSRTKAINAVTIPPMNSMSPVPTRFLTPSTSDMMREINAPVLFAS